MRLKPDPLGGPRDPLRVTLLLWFAISGTALALGLNVSVTLTDELGVILERVYGAMLAISALLTLAGMFWPWDPRDGLTAKFAGWSGLAVTSVIFALATIRSWSMTGLFVAVTALIFAAYSARLAHLVASRMRAAVKIESSRLESS